MRTEIAECEKYEGRCTNSAFFQILRTERLLKSQTITSVKALADTLTQRMMPVCVDLVMHMLCLVGAPTCNQDTCLPMLICKESCDMLKRIRESKFCEVADNHFRRIQTSNVIFEDIFLLIDIYFNFDCEDPSTYFFTNISNPDTKACTKLLSPGLLCKLIHCVI